MGSDYDVTRNKILRRNLDSHIQELKALSPSRERSLSITKLQEAVMWLGMDLKRLETLNPCPKDLSNTIVDPTADSLTL